VYVLLNIVLIVFANVIPGMLRWPGGAPYGPGKPRGDGVADYTRDIAAVAAVTLTHSRHDGKKYVLTGPEALSYFDVARILSEAVGRPITYVPLSLEEARERMGRAGEARWASEGLLALAAYQRAGGTDGGCP
jgi:uncharacterized protein YbjT (DUF2867 family)